MPRVEIRWLGVHPSGKSAVFGLSAVAKRPQSPVSDDRKLVEGSMGSSWIGQEIPRSPEVIRRMRHTSGGHPPGWQRW